MLSPEFCWRSSRAEFQERKDQRFNQLDLSSSQYTDVVTQCSSEAEKMVVKSIIIVGLFASVNTLLIPLNSLDGPSVISNFPQIRSAVGLIAMQCWEMKQSCLPRTLTEKWRYMASLKSGFSRIQNESDDYHIQTTHSMKNVRTQESRRICKTSFNL